MRRVEVVGRSLGGSTRVPRLAEVAANKFVDLTCISIPAPDFEKSASVSIERGYSL